MRLRLTALAFIAASLAVVCGACKFSGVSAVYMTIDSGGYQNRAFFFTDTTAIYCVALFSTAKQDSTVDFTILELAGPDGAKPLHHIFSTGEVVPGPQVESPTVFQIPPNGIDVQIQCSGYCLQNGVGCPGGYVDQGDDSCGVGATCCYNAFAQAATAPAILPYQVGTYQCQVSIDGVLQPEQPTFDIRYPPVVDGQICPVEPPVNGIICTGWVPMGSKCQGFNSKQTCTCNGTAWDCEPPI